MEISRACMDDLSEVLKLRKLAFKIEAELYNDHEIEPLTQTLEGIREEAQNVIILKADDGAGIIGSVKGYEKDGTCYIGKLVVHPKYQNRGIGRKLMDTIEMCFKPARYELFTGYRSEKNLAFYEKLGYRRFKTERVNDKLQFVYFEKIAGDRPDRRGE